MYQQIAIALDGSPAALTAAAFARHLAARVYRVVHVVETGGPFNRPVRPEGIPEAERAELVARMRTAARSAMGRAASDTGLTVEIRSGDPVDELIAASESADLIVLTTRGRGVAGRALFGSVADEVARRGVRPTLVLRPDHDLRYPQRVIVPLDGGDGAERAIPVARSLATTLGCPVLLVHVVDQEDLEGAPFSQEPDTAAADDQPAGRDAVATAIDQATAYLRRHEQRLGADGLVVQHRVVIGDTIPALVEFADPADIVVVASRGNAGLRRLVDPSVAEQLVRHAPSPVLVVHDRTRSADHTTVDPVPEG